MPMMNWTSDHVSAARGSGRCAKLISQRKSSPCSLMLMRRLRADSGPSGLVALPTLRAITVSTVTARTASARGVISVRHSLFTSCLRGPKASIDDKWKASRLRAGMGNGSNAPLAPAGPLREISNLGANLFLAATLLSAPTAVINSLRARPRVAQPAQFAQPDFYISHP